jgi:hypothetical protein
MLDFVALLVAVVTGAQPIHLSIANHSMLLANLVPLKASITKAKASSRRVRTAQPQGFQLPVPEKLSAPQSWNAANSAGAAFQRILAVAV